MVRATGIGKDILSGLGLLMLDQEKKEVVVDVRFFLVCLLEMCLSLLSCR